MLPSPAFLFSFTLEYRQMSSQVQQSSWDQEERKYTPEISNFLVSAPLYNVKKKTKTKNNVKNLRIPKTFCLCGFYPLIFTVFEIKTNYSKNMNPLIHLELTTNPVNINIYMKNNYFSKQKP